MLCQTELNSPSPNGSLAGRSVDGRTSFKRRIELDNRTLFVRYRGFGDAATVLPHGIVLSRLGDTGSTRAVERIGWTPGD